RAGEVVLAGEDGVRDPQEEVAPLGGGPIGPHAVVEGAAGREDRAFDVCGRGLRDHADVGAVGRTGHRAGGPVGGGDPGSVDVQGGCVGCRHRDSPSAEGAADVFVPASGWSVPAVSIVSTTAWSVSHHWSGTSAFMSVPGAPFSPVRVM